ncbi:MAG: phospholipase D family protein [Candidatus Methylacidiphilales bacterium]|nr:phospholipase D family protein [Candidatus Methylacidiphilales bacterium]
MSISAKILFEEPQHEIASLIRDRLEQCVSASIVSGFITVEGVNAICEPIKKSPHKLGMLIVGSGTHQAFSALDDLLSIGVSPNNLYVHLGHTCPSSGKKNPFHRYRPMLHSKIYLMDMANGTSCAFVGSNNVTGFALLGLNGEASVLLDGHSNDPEFQSIRNHIHSAKSQSAIYSPHMKDALSWWTLQFVEGLRTKVKDMPSDGEARKTIVVLSAKTDSVLPRVGEIIYFEVPANLGEVSTLSAEVHFYVFDSKTATPDAGLLQLDQARASLMCKVVGLELRQGGRELEADWHVVSKTDPKLLRAPNPFRPIAQPGMQQVRVQVLSPMKQKYRYSFDSERDSWDPVYSDEEPLRLAAEDKSFLPRNPTNQSEDQPWRLVTDLQPRQERPMSNFEKAVKESSPTSGSYIMISPRRYKA